MEDGTGGDGDGDSDKLERLRHAIEEIDPDETARMVEAPQPRGKADRSDVNAGFPWLGVVVVGVAVAVLVALVVYIVLNAPNAEFRNNIG